jgi:protein-tyrosine phosphatase
VIDLHVHILPGLDDGAKDAAEALEMCRIASEDGTTAIVATPHMGVDGAASREQILAAVASLQRTVTLAGIRLRILPGADMRLEPELPQDVRAGRAVTVGDAGKHLLVEISRDVVPPGVEGVLFELHLRGLRPIITHPERNLAVQADPDILLPLLRAGNAAQLTAGSLTGEFGRDAQRCARQLLKRRMAHFIASDAHSARHRLPRLGEARKVAEELVGRDETAEIFEKRPDAVISGRELDLPGPVKRRRSRVKDWMGRLGGRKHHGNS